MNTVLELRNAVGGNDSKLLVEDMANLYIKVCRLNNFEIKTLQ